MKALVVNALGRGFDLEDVDIASPIAREVLVEVQASGLCHTDLLFAANNIVPFPAVFGHEVSGSSPRLAWMSHNSASAITSWARLYNRVDRARDANPAAASSVSTRKQRCGGRGMRRA